VLTTARYTHLTTTTEQDARQIINDLINRLSDDRGAS